VCVFLVFVFVCLGFLFVGGFGFFFGQPSELRKTRSLIFMQKTSPSALVLPPPAVPQEWFSSSLSFLRLRRED